MTWSSGCSPIRMTFRARKNQFKKENGKTNNQWTNIYAFLTLQSLTVSSSGRSKHDNSEFAICPVVRHGNVNSIHNPATGTNPTMELYCILLSFTLPCRPRRLFIFLGQPQTNCNKSFSTTMHSSEVPKMTN